eukprot:gene26436-biopygen16455
MPESCRNSTGATFIPAALGAGTDGARMRGIGSFDSSSIPVAKNLLDMSCSVFNDKIHRKAYRGVEGIQGRRCSLPPALGASTVS